MKNFLLEIDTCLYCPEMKILMFLTSYRSNCIPGTNGHGGYYGLVVVMPPPHPQRFHRSHDNLKNLYQIASIFYM